MSSVIGARPTYYCNQCCETKPEVDFSEFARDQARHGDENTMCQDCVTRLFKGRLQTGGGEINAYIAEDRARRLQRSRNPRLEEMIGEGRWGTPMESNELIRRLLKLPDVVVGPGTIQNNLSFYRVRNERVDFICWTDAGLLPEFSIVHFNKDRQPIREQRGWRTVVLRFIKSGLLTEMDAQNMFGRAEGIQARFWEQEMYWHRNIRTEGQNVPGEN